MLACTCMCMPLSVFLSVCLFPICVLQGIKLSHYENNKNKSLKIKKSQTFLTLHQDLLSLRNRLRGRGGERWGQQEEGRECKLGLVRKMRKDCFISK